MKKKLKKIEHYNDKEYCLCCKKYKKYWIRMKPGEDICVGCVWTGKYDEKHKND